MLDFFSEKEYTVSRIKGREILSFILNMDTTYISKGFKSKIVENYEKRRQKLKRFFFSPNGTRQLDLYILWR